MIGLLGVWMTVVVPLGPHLANIPGDLGDSRLNNYLLEHFFRWVSGLDKSFWDAPIYFPFPNTTAFSDNFLGSGFFYSIFRWLGLDRESAFQGWYIWGFCLNYAAAALVLTRFGFKQIAVAAGAYFFTFGLPVFAQEGHVQLLYRFAIPLACFCIYQLFESPKLSTIAWMLFWTVWQFYLSIYTGLFGFFLLVSLAIFIPFFPPDQTILGLLKFWPEQIKMAWDRSPKRERVFTITFTLILFIALASLFWPYYQVTKLFGFVRKWDEILSMLPMWRSYLIADRSEIWGPVSKLFPDFVMRHEHNLFIGVSAILILGIGLIFRKNFLHKKVVKLHVVVAILLIVLTFTTQGFSLYSLIINLPGVSSIRAVTRIILILMWPAALVIASIIDQLLNPVHRRGGLIPGVAYVLIIGLILDPIFFDHHMFRKYDAQQRVSNLKSQIPIELPEQPILIVSNNKNDPAHVTDLDGMLLAQELGLPSLNGYSGSNPPGFGLTYTCRSIPQRILATMEFAGIDSETYYTEMMNRVVPLGFSDCNPNWGKQKPTIFAGTFPSEIFTGLSIEVVSLEKVENRITADVKVSNISSLTLPLLSSTDNPFRLSWRLVNVETNQGLSGFDARIDLDSDLIPGMTQLIKISDITPALSGKYRLDVSAVQEGVDWFYNRGLPVVSSKQGILLDGQKNLSVIELQ